MGGPAFRFWIEEDMGWGVPRGDHSPWYCHPIMWWQVAVWSRGAASHHRAGRLTLLERLCRLHSVLLKKLLKKTKRR